MLSFLTLRNISKCYIPSKFLSPFIWNFATIITIRGWNIYSIFFHPSKQRCRIATGRVKFSLLPVSVNKITGTQRCSFIHSLCMIASRLGQQSWVAATYTEGPGILWYLPLTLYRRGLLTPDLEKNYLEAKSSIL